LTEERKGLKIENLQFWLVFGFLWKNLFAQFIHKWCGDIVGVSCS